jgi:hypothetical protein
MDIPWKWDTLFENYNIKWDFDFLQLNAEIIQTTSNYGPVDMWKILSSNPTISENDIQNNIDEKWNFNILSQNPNLTLAIVLNNPKKEWSWDHLSIYLPWIDILENPDKDWNYEYVSVNTSVDFNTIKQNPDVDWNYESLSYNTMERAKDKYINSKPSGIKRKIKN